MSAPDLARLENWLQDAILRPSLPASARAPLREPATRHVLPSDRLAPDERVAIYADMYVMRTLDCLTSDYPALRAVAGVDVFQKIVRGYLALHPSRHWSMNHLGRKLPEYLSGPVRFPRRALLRDVAAVECAMSIVFDAPRENVIGPKDLAKLAPEVLADPKPQLIAALEILALDHRANAIVNAARRDEPMPKVTRAKTHTVVWRKEDVVWRMDIPPIGYAMLASLKKGARLSEAVEAGARIFRGTPEDLASLVSRSFGEWISEGFFTSVE